MSRASDKSKSFEAGKEDIDEVSLSEDDEPEDEEASDREETPDLYRNSSLGM